MARTSRRSPGLASRGESSRQRDPQQDGAQKPYYNKNKTAICTFWLRNACTRADCPYRPCNGDTHMPELTSAPEMRTQNIKDRYYGVNDPVAEKMLKRAESTPALKPRRMPPSPRCTWAVSISASRRMICATRFIARGTQVGGLCTPRIMPFVTHVERKGAETAAEALHGNLVVNGLKLRLMWGKPAKPKGSAARRAGRGRARARVVLARAGRSGRRRDPRPCRGLSSPRRGRGREGGVSLRGSERDGNATKDPSADQAAEGGGR